MQQIEADMGADGRKTMCCYLLAYHDGKMQHFRADRMEDVELRTVEQNGLKVVVPRDDKEEHEKIDMSSCTNCTFSMYSGEVRNVERVFLDRMRSKIARLLRSL